MNGSELDRLAATSVTAEFLNRQMGASRARSIILCLDCCYAGAFDRGPRLPTLFLALGAEKVRELLTPR